MVADVLRLSRENTNVISFDVSVHEKRHATKICLSALSALIEAVGDIEGLHGDVDTVRPRLVRRELTPSEVLAKGPSTSLHRPFGASLICPCAMIK